MDEYDDLVVDVLARAMTPRKALQFIGNRIMAMSCQNHPPDIQREIGQHIRLDSLKRSVRRPLSEQTRESVGKAAVIRFKKRNPSIVVPDDLLKLLK